MTTVQITTTVAGVLTTYTTAASVATPEAVTSEAITTYVPPPAAATTVASNSTLQSNATPTAITFTGGAPGNVNILYSAAVGCAVGLAAMLLL